jgi:hypothetical protein
MDGDVYGIRTTIDASKHLHLEDSSYLTLNKHECKQVRIHAWRQSKPLAIFVFSDALSSQTAFASILVPQTTMLARYTKHLPLERNGHMANADHAWGKSTALYLHTARFQACQRNADIRLSQYLHLYSSAHASACLSVPCTWWIAALSSVTCNGNRKMKVCSCCPFPAHFTSSASALGILKMLILTTEGPNTKLLEADAVRYCEPSSWNQIRKNCRAWSIPSCVAPDVFSGR